MCAERACYHINPSFVLLRLLAHDLGSVTVSGLALSATTRKQEQAENERSEPAGRRVTLILAMDGPPLGRGSHGK